MERQGEGDENGKEKIRRYSSRERQEGRRGEKAGREKEYHAQQ